LPLPPEVEQWASNVAGSDVTVLIGGETGTGKTVLAKRIHDRSRRADRPFERVDCAALAEGLFESELFGHTKGAFTGAASEREGLLVRGRGGSVFLDEISVLTKPQQARLLTVLDERKVRKLGGDETVEIDVRFICATNENLPALVEEGRFRQDLLFRCGPVDLVLPPLRERLGELPAIVRRVVWELMPLLPPSCRERVEVTGAALAVLREQRFAGGNIRQLRNVLARAAIGSKGGTVDEQAVVRALASRKARRGDGEAAAGDDTPLEERTRYRAPENPAEERRMIVEALKKAKGDKTKAAHLLRMHRRTLYRKIDEYDIRDEEWRTPETGSDG
jgi:two-component system response regulator AtoC